MNTALNNLEFVVSLIDRVSQPMGKIMTTIDKASRGFNQGFSKIGYGAAGLAGAAYSVSNLLEPTKEMQRSLGEVRSLGVANETLNALQKTALQTSAQFGLSASDITRSSYDIQSAIAGLSGNELPAFTRASAILAKGTKASTQEVTSFVGTMYNIFQKNADAMGKAQWVEMLTGQTAEAVKLFKTTGKGMADAFEGVGAAGQLNNIAMNEQIAILGRLQGSMSGAEAGTKYRTFLDNVGKAQKTLNLEFTDAQGRMLPIVDILTRIRDKFGAIDTVAKSDLLKKAFGTEEAVALVKALSLNIEGLNSDITTIGANQGMQNAIEMAQAMTDPWGRLSAGIDAVSISIGTALLPVLNPFLESISAMLQSISAWADANPQLAKTLGMLTLGIFGVIGTLALFSIASGAATVISTGWGVAMAWLFSPLKGLVLAVFGAIPAIWSFTAAIFANPMTWWALGIAAVVSAVVAAVVYWDVWTAKVIGWAQNFQIGLSAVTQHIIDLGLRFFEMIGAVALVDVALAAWERLKGWWSAFKGWLSSLNPFDAILSGFNKVMALAGKLPGLNIGSVATAPAPVNTGAKAAGGLMNKISSVMNAKNSTVGEVHVHNYGQPMSGAKLRDELLFAGG